jgi:hypothetical protein
MCESVQVPILEAGIFQPYDWEKSTKSWGSTSVLKRIFVKTTKFVPPDEEIIVDYGVGYYARHPFTDDQE